MGYPPHVIEHTPAAAAAATRKSYCEKTTSGLATIFL